MLKIGDEVKIINTYDCTTDIMEKELGIIGKITDIDIEEDGTIIYEVNNKFWWIGENLQKGHMEWISDEN